MTMTTRAGKGSPLSNAEIDANFTELAAHISDTSAAHAASAISFTPDSYSLADDVQEALGNARDWAAQATEYAVAHVNDAAGAHAASAISNTPAGEVVSTTVQGAINELDSAKAPREDPIFTGTVEVDGFTKLGSSSSPAVKFIKLTGTTAATEGGTVNITHSLNSAKILGFTCKVEHVATRGMFPAHTFWPGYQYDVYFDDTKFVVANHATNSENVLSKPIAILVIYEE
jgi:hypothetical protein